MDTPRYHAVLSTSRGVFVRDGLVKIAGDLKSGVLLSQLLYWFTPDASGKIKLTVEREGKYWLAKSAKDWSQECWLSEREVSVAVKNLKDKGLVETNLWKWAAVPTLHFRPIPEAIETALAAIEEEVVEVCTQVEYDDQGQPIDHSAVGYEPGKSVSRKEANRDRDNRDTGIAKSAEPNSRYSRNDIQRVPTEITTEITDRTPERVSRDDASADVTLTQPSLDLVEVEGKNSAKKRPSDRPSWQTAKSILNEWWERQDPKPAQRWEVCHGIVEKFVKQKWPDEAITYMLDNAAVVSTGAMTLAWNKRPDAKKAKRQDELIGVAQRYAERNGLTAEDFERSEF